MVKTINEKNVSLNFSQNKYSLPITFRQSNPDSQTKTNKLKNEHRYVISDFISQAKSQFFNLSYQHSDSSCLESASLMLTHITKTVDKSNIICTKHQHVDIVIVRMLAWWH